MSRDALLNAAEAAETCPRPLQPPIASSFTRFPRIVQLCGRYAPPRQCVQWRAARGARCVCTCCVQPEPEVFFLLSNCPSPSRSTLSPPHPPPLYQPLPPTAMLQVPVSGSVRWFVRSFARSIGVPISSFVYHPNQRSNERSIERTN